MSAGTNYSPDVKNKGVTEDTQAKFALGGASIEVFYFPFCEKKKSWQFFTT